MAANLGEFMDVESEVHFLFKIEAIIQFILQNSIFDIPLKRFNCYDII